MSLSTNTTNFSDKTVSTRDIYQWRIAPIVDRLMDQKPLYQEEFEHSELTDYLIAEMAILPPKQFLAMQDKDLLDRFRKLISIELVFGMLNDLPPEELKVFDESITRH